MSMPSCLEVRPLNGSDRTPNLLVSVYFVTGGTSGSETNTPRSVSQRSSRCVSDNRSVSSSSSERMSGWYGMNGPPCPIISLSATGTMASSFRPVRRMTSSTVRRSEEHTSELQSLMRTSYAVFCLKKQKLHTQLLSHTNY